MKWLFRDRLSVFDCLSLIVCLHFFLGDYIMMAVVMLLAGFISGAAQSILKLSRKGRGETNE